MSRIIGILVFLGTASVSVGQEIYVVIRSVPDIRIVKMNADGSELAIVVTNDDVVAAMHALIPDSTDGSFTGEYYVDSVNRKLYFVGQYEDTVSALALPALLRSNLDGTNIEVVVAPMPPDVANNEVFILPQVLQLSTIPALGNVGLGILVATIAAAGGWIVSRRTGFARAE